MPKNPELVAEAVIIASTAARGNCGVAAVGDELCPRGIITSLPSGGDQGKPRAFADGPLRQGFLGGRHQAARVALATLTATEGETD
ncbi:MAG: hypothetical protein ACLFUU_11345 [Desulfobacteraceae bacterium]